MSDTINPLPASATTCALIKDGVVINMIVASPGDWVPDGCLLICDPPLHVTIGTKYVDDEFVEPPKAEPK
jgi:hypothetical protein